MFWDQLVDLQSVNLYENAESYLSYNRIIACGGSWMVKGDLIKEGRFDEIEALTREAAELVRKYR